MHVRMKCLCESLFQDPPKPVCPTAHQTLSSTTFADLSARTLFCHEQLKTWRVNDRNPLQKQSSYRLMAKPLIGQIGVFAVRDWTALVKGWKCFFRFVLHCYFGFVLLFPEGVRVGDGVCAKNMRMLRIRRNHEVTPNAATIRGALHKTLRHRVLV